MIFFPALICQRHADAVQGGRAERKQHEHQQYQRTVHRKGPPVNGNRECTRDTDLAERQKQKQAEGCQASCQELAREHFLFGEWQAADKISCRPIAGCAEKHPIGLGEEPHRPNKHKAS